MREKSEGGRSEGREKGSKALLCLCTRCCYPTSWLAQAAVVTIYIQSLYKFVLVASWSLYVKASRPSHSFGFRWKNN